VIVVFFLYSQRNDRKELNENNLREFSDGDDIENEEKISFLLVEGRSVFLSRLE
jgi:hypothetical protein